MPGFRIGGLASGLPPNLVDQLIEAERLPIKTQEANRGKDESKLKLVSELETKISDIQKSVDGLVGIRGFESNKFISGDPNIIAGTVDPEMSVNGTWHVEVKQLPQKPAAISNGFPDKDKSEIGVGYFKFETSEGVKEVYINGASTTLEGAARAINQANIGVRASVINDRADKENPFKLMIAGLATGDEKQVSFPHVYLLDGDQDFFFDQTKEAKNGRVVVDGFEFEISDNPARDLIPGVTLDLKQSAPGRDIMVTIKEDTEVISGKIDEFVKASNGALQFIQSQNQLTQKTDTSKTLGGDGLLRSIESRLRSLIQSPQYGVAGAIKSLGDLGIQFQRNGTLAFEKKKFDAELARAPKDVQQFFGGDGVSSGFIPALKREMGNILNQAYGPLSNRKRGLQSRIDAINKQIESKERALSKREETLRRQFSKLEETMSKLNSQGAAVGAVTGMGGAKAGQQ